MHSASLTLYILAVPSELAEASLVPVLLKDKSRTSSVCPVKTLTSEPVLTSQSLQVPSIEEVAQ